MPHASPLAFRTVRVGDQILRFAIQRARPYQPKPEGDVYQFCCESCARGDACETPSDELPEDAPFGWAQPEIWTF